MLEQLRKADDQLAETLSSLAKVVELLSKQICSIEERVIKLERGEK